MMKRFDECKQSGYLDFPKICDFSPNKEYYNNFIHRYPAKMLNQIPYAILPFYAKKGDTILDCFCGSGTTLMQARLFGMHAIGFDINPIAVLISRVKANTFNCNILLKEITSLFEKIENTTVIEENIPQFKNRDFWFEKNIQYDIAKILKNIKEVENIKYREFFLVCLSSIIRKISNADFQIIPPVKSKKMIDIIENGREIDTINIFKEAVYLNFKRISKFSKDCVKNTDLIVKQANTRKIPLVNESVDLVITSPPYITAQKYARSTRLEMAWLGLTNEDNYKKIDIDTIGTERISIKDIDQINETGYPLLDKYIKIIKQRNQSRAFMAYKYFIDMEKCLNEIYRVLKINKYFILVIGNNNVTRIQIPNNKIITEIAQSIGFIKEEEYIDDIKYYGFMTKRNKSAGIIDSERIIIFKKSEIQDSKSLKSNLNNGNNKYLFKL